MVPQLSHLISAGEVATTSVELPGPHTSESLRQLQLADTAVGPVLRSVEANTQIDPVPTSKTSKRLLQLREQMVVCGGVLCRRYRPTGVTKTVIQLVIPMSLKEQVLADLHEGAVGGHLGADKTLGRLRERYYWPGYYNDVCEWCRNCPTCASRKSPSPKARAPLQPIVTSRPLQLVATDILGPLPESPAGNLYVLVVSDYFTRYSEAYAIPNQEAVTVARKLVDEFFLRFSPPERLHSDQGRNFESSVIAEVCQLLGVEKSRTTPYHPQSDGLVERFNRTLLDMLATAVGEKPFEWEQNLRRLCFAYNTCIHPTTGYSPFALMFGRQARLPMDIVLGATSPSSSTTQQYAVQLQADLEAAYSHVRDRMGHKLQQQKVRYDLRAHGKPFEEGDLVWLHSPATPRGKSRKLHRPWTGPYRVVRKLGDSVYRLQHTQNRRRRPVVHFNRLKHCPSTIRLPSESCQNTQTPEQPKAVSTPVGTNVELVEDDTEVVPSQVTGQPDGDAESGTRDSATTCREHTPDSPPLPQPLSPPPSSSSTAPPPIQPRRYPQRDRSAPVRLYSAIPHGIRGQIPI